MTINFEEKNKEYLSSGGVKLAIFVLLFFFFGDGGGEKDVLD